MSYQKNSSQLSKDKITLSDKAKKFAMQTLCLCLLWAPFSAHADYAAIVIDANTGDIISEHNKNQLWFPASLAKVMTLYLTFSALKANQITLEDEVKVSKQVAVQPNVRLGLRQGQTITVKQAVLAVIIRSANDAALLLAEHIADTPSSFAKKMTQQAQTLGMNNTVFRNATGLPNKNQVTTAWDMAILAQAIYQDFPEYYGYFSTPMFKYNKKSYSNSNSLLRLYRGTDGMKTGFTCDAGYNLITSVQRNEQRLIAVLMGAQSTQRRTQQMIKLLNQAFKTAQTTVTTTNIAQPQQKSLQIAKVQLSAAQCYKPKKPVELLKPNQISKETIIFGAFHDKQMATELIEKIKPKMGDYAKQGNQVIKQHKLNGVLLWHVLWSGLELKDAGKICKTLWQQDEYCRVLHSSLFTDEKAQWQ